MRYTSSHDFAFSDKSEFIEDLEYAVNENECFVSWDEQYIHFSPNTMIATLRKDDWVVHIHVYVEKSKVTITISFGCIGKVMKTYVPNASDGGDQIATIMCILNDAPNFETMLTSIPTF